MSLSAVIQELFNQEFKAINKLLDGLDENKLRLAISDRQTVATRLRHMARSTSAMVAPLLETDVSDFDISGDLTIIKIYDIFRGAQDNVNTFLLQSDKLDWNSTWKTLSDGTTRNFSYFIWQLLTHLASHRGQLSMILLKDKEA